MQAPTISRRICIVRECFVRSGFAQRELMSLFLQPARVRSLPGQGRNRHNASSTHSLLLEQSRPRVLPGAYGEPVDLPAILTSNSQAMNLVTASFLIYMSEEQCFWCLTVLCDRLVPGYYRCGSLQAPALARDTTDLSRPCSPSMYGTVLDQRVFEHLVQKCLPAIHDHFAEADVQLSVASLPWFLSLYISSLPMVFAFRIIDCFFLMGPKVLFQVGYVDSRALIGDHSSHRYPDSLAILKVNGPALLKTTDDGAFIK